MQFGIVGSGSWATALVKILTDNHHTVNWWVRNDDTLEHLRQRRHNPHYLSATYFDDKLLRLSGSIHFITEQSDLLIIALPSTYIHSILSTLNTDAFIGKKIISAVKGLLPDSNQLLNEYLETNFGLDRQNYFAILGPCHAEEVAAEKLSYLTFAGKDETTAREIAAYFKNEYLNTVINADVMGVQYAAVLKNIYAMGAGMAHGLDYGDNFLSVYIANAADEMVHFLKKARQDDRDERLNYAASVYLGDLLVTCYSLYSRNRTFGNMIGKGYSVKAASLEMNMVAEGYNACRCMHSLNNDKVHANIPIADNIYEILWEQVPAIKAFKQIEKELV